MTKRRRRSRAEWQTLIAQFHASDDDAAEFCRQHDLGRLSFDKWRLRFGRPAASGFAELKPAPRQRVAMAEATVPLAISLGDARLELPADVPALRVAELMRAIGHA